MPATDGSTTGMERRRSWLWRTAVFANIAFAALLSLTVLYYGVIWEVQGGSCLFGDPRGCREQMIFFSTMVLVVVWIVVDLVIGAIAIVRYLARRS